MWGLRALWRSVGFWLLLALATCWLLDTGIAQITAWIQGWLPAQAGAYFIFGALGVLAGLCFYGGKGR